MPAPVMHGFGSPDTLAGLADPAGFDWGFGDDPDLPGGSNPAPDPGFGDIPTGLSALHPALPSDGHVYPDDGGDLVTLTGDWSQALPVALGPYRVRLFDAAGQTWPPPERADGCYSALLGKGSGCETDIGRTTLTFGLPRLPPGVYDIEVAWGDAFSDTLLLQGALRVIWRGRAQQVYSLRGAGFPPKLDVGARSLLIEPIVPKRA
uniref:Uncharacterized protein n=1 Tax=uncultured Caudovirales phage TaxID=2100421 RepID=A0A6J5L2F5_9CAUD|nr:hypothetical protein UFOVP114_40 [uncultured Caudovirales phage]